MLILLMYSDFKFRKYGGKYYEPKFFGMGVSSSLGLNFYWPPIYGDHAEK